MLRRQLRITEAAEEPHLSTRVLLNIIVRNKVAVACRRKVLAPPCVSISHNLERLIWFISCSCWSLGCKHRCHRRIGILKPLQVNPSCHTPLMPTEFSDFVLGFVVLIPCCTRIRHVANEPSTKKTRKVVRRLSEVLTEVAHYSRRTATSSVPFDTRRQ